MFVQSGFRSSLELRLLHDSLPLTEELESLFEILVDSRDHRRNVIPCVLPFRIGVSLAQSVGGDFPSLSIQRNENENAADGQIVGLAVRLAELEFPTEPLHKERLMRKFPDSVETDHGTDHRIVLAVVVLDIDILRERTEEAGSRIAESIPAGLRELELFLVMRIADDAPPS